MPRVRGSLLHSKVIQSSSLPKYLKNLDQSCKKDVDLGNKVPFYS